MDEKLIMQKAPEDTSTYRDGETLPKDKKNAIVQDEINFQAEGGRE